MASAPFPPVRRDHRRIAQQLWFPRPSGSLCPSHRSHRKKRDGLARSGVAATADNRLCRAGLGRSGSGSAGGRPFAAGGADVGTRERGHRELGHRGLDPSRKWAGRQGSTYGLQRLRPRISSALCWRAGLAAGDVGIVRRFLRHGCCGGRERFGVERRGHRPRPHGRR